ncbi:uncharacterized protein [Nicotiana sylvestris]|uniref:uncharacterized protein n=1 Tax=Nicotiana sylvestris TaxID=4096 RepID=UPI00388C6E87
MKFRYVHSIQNEFADALATLSSMIPHPNKNFTDPIPVRVHNQPAYCAHVQEETNGKPWFHDIKEYLVKGEYSKHANCTAVRTSTGVTPYMLVYGTEVVILAEVEVPSLRIIQEAELSDAEWVRSLYEQLPLI